MHIQIYDLFILFYRMVLSLMRISVSHEHSANKHQKRASESLELNLQKAVIHHDDAFNQTWPSTGVGSALII